MNVATRLTKTSNYINLFYSLLFILLFCVWGCNKGAPEDEQEDPMEEEMGYTYPEGKIYFESAPLDLSGVAFYKHLCP